MSNVTLGWLRRHRGCSFSVSWGLRTAANVYETSQSLEFFRNRFFRKELKKWYTNTSSNYLMPKPFSFMDAKSEWWGTRTNKYRVSGYFGLHTFDICRYPGYSGRRYLGCPIPASGIAVYARSNILPRASGGVCETLLKMKNFRNYCSGDIGLSIRREAGVMSYLDVYDWMND